MSDPNLMKFYKTIIPFTLAGRKFDSLQFISFVTITDPTRAHGINVQYS